MHYDKIINPEPFFLHHEQADVTLDTLGFTAGCETIDRFDLHGYSEAHQIIPCLLPV